MTRDVVHRIGLAVDDRCPGCGEPDSVEHLLVDCPVYMAKRSQLWGPVPTIGEVFEDGAEKIVAFLRGVGRVEPPLDAPPQ